MPFATFIIEDTDKSDLEYFLLAGYVLGEEKKSSPLVGNWNPVRFTEGFPVYRGIPRTA